MAFFTMKVYLQRLELRAKDRRVAKRARFVRLLLIGARSSSYVVAKGKRQDGSHVEEPEGAR